MFFGQIEVAKKKSKRIFNAPYYTLGLGHPFDCDKDRLKYDSKSEPRDFVYFFLICLF